MIGCKKLISYVLLLALLLTFVPVGVTDAWAATTAETILV